MTTKPAETERLFVTLSTHEAERYQAVSEDRIREALAQGKAERDAAAADVSSVIAPSNLLFRCAETDCDTVS